MALNRIKACQWDYIYPSNKSINQALLYCSLVFNILCVTYFLTSINMPATTQTATQVAK